MTTLMMYAGPAADDAPVTRTGGVPLAPPGFNWPTCQGCHGLMRFLAQVMLSDLPSGSRPGVLSIFMCQNDPGMCDEWDPGSGANTALIFPGTDLVPVAGPDVGGGLLSRLRKRGRPASADGPRGEGTALGEVSAVRYVKADGSYDEARRDPAQREGRPGGEVLGQLGGEPGWVQDDETPACPECARPMSFVVQLEQGRNDAAHPQLNFGDLGCGYGFACYPCGRAAFLFQSS